MRRPVLLSLLLVGIGGLAAACPPARVCVQPARAVAVHQRAVVVVPVQAVAVAVIPAYAVSYNYAADQQSALTAELRALREEVIRLRGAVQSPAVSLVPASPPAVAKPARDLVGLLTVCAQCHQPATSATKGGAFALFSDKGEVVPLDAATRKKNRDLITSGKMPRGDKFSEAERKLTADYLDPPEQIGQPKD